MAAAMETAAAMDAKKGVFHARSFAKPDAWDHEWVRDLIFESVDEVSAAGPAVFEACAENLKGPFVDASDFPAIFERTDATVCLDTGHDTLPVTTVHGRPTSSASTATGFRTST